MLTLWYLHRYNDLCLLIYMIACFVFFGYFHYITCKWLDIFTKCREHTCPDLTEQWLRLTHTSYFAAPGHTSSGQLVLRCLTCKTVETDAGAADWVNLPYTLHGAINTPSNVKPWGAGPAGVECNGVAFHTLHSTQLPPRWVNP